MIIAHIQNQRVIITYNVLSFLTTVSPYGLIIRAERIIIILNVCQQKCVEVTQSKFFLVMCTVPYTQVVVQLQSLKDHTTNIIMYL